VVDRSYDQDPELHEAAEVERHRFREPKTAALAVVAFENLTPRLGEAYLIKGLIGAATIGMIYGESGTGKTFLALHLGLCVASETEFFGYRPRQTGVIYIAAEAGAGIANRVAAARYEFGYADKTPFAAIVTPIDLCTSDVDLNRLIDAIKTFDIGAQVGLIIVDTLSRVMAGGNENTPDDMGALVQNIDRLCAATGATILLVHHSGKDPGRGARGHSLLHAAIDTEIEVTREAATKLSAFRVTKQRDISDEGSGAFSLRVVEIGRDLEDDPVTSCVVIPSLEQPSKRGAARKLSAPERRALDLLQDAISRSGEVPPASSYIPSGQLCVTEASWRESCYRGGIATTDTAAAKQKAYKRAAERLLEYGRIGKWEPWVWLISP
jgi:hypothetical protein